MLAYFTSYDLFFFVSLLLGVPIFLVVLAGPIFVFYWVFRNPTKRETDYKFIRASSPRLSAVCVAASVVIILFAKSSWLFENQPDINRLLFISVMVAALALVLGILSLPRWQGFIALFVALANYLFVWFIFILAGQNRFHK